MNEGFIDKFRLPERGTLKCPECKEREVYRLYYTKDDKYNKTDKTLRFCENCGVIKLKLEVRLEHVVLKI